MTRPGAFSCVAMTLALGAAPHSARAQKISVRGAACVSLDCAAAQKSYSFEPPVRAQESQSATSIPQQAAASPDFVREGVWRKLPGNFVHDQKDMWLAFPAKLAQEHYWLPTALLTGATAALIYTDPKTLPYFRQTDFFQDSDHALGSKVSGAVIAAVPATFYVVGVIRKDSYAQGTSVLAGEAVVDDTVLMIVTKAIMRRQRPTERAVNGNYNDTFFN